MHICGQTVVNLIVEQVAALLTYQDELLKAALDQAKEGSAQTNKGPIEFIVSNTSYFKVLKIDYHGGQRYPYLERVKGEKDVLEEILKPLAPVKK